MADRPFVHLHCHSHYSLLDGANRIPELVQQTKKLGMNAIALTDHGNLYGAIELYRESTAVGIKPLIGYEAYVAPTKRTDRSSGKRGDAANHLTLIAYNNEGFKNLIKMASIAFLEGYYYVPRIDKEVLEAHSKGIVCLSGCLAGEFNDLILKDQRQKALELTQWYTRVFGEHFYIELQNNGLEIQDQCTVVAREIANEVGVPMVATADAHYLCQEDAIPHDVLVCINTGKKRSDPNRMRYGNDSRYKNPYYVRSPEDMYRLFPGLEDAVATSQKIADYCDVKLDFKKRHFPVFVPPNAMKPEDYLRELGLEGVKKRYGENPRPEVMARFEHELSIICKMGFASYFLITWDFVRYALDQGIPCSARGSGCGAMMCYVLELSHVDPLEYDLLFERFLDPNRSEAPDIDIDFCQDRREEVIEYVKRKYGRDSVAQIATFGTMAAKAAIKDVGRVLEIPLDRVNFMTKQVPTRLGASIEDALNESPDFKREYDHDPIVKEWIDIAMKLEGTNRNAGTHAAGVVIANGPITDYVPVHRVIRKGDNEDGDKKGEAIITTQWVMGDLEKVGMLKMDFLGLRTLTLLTNCLKLIKKTRGKDINVFELPLDDQPTYDMLQKGDAKGVFQFESDGIRELLKRMKPDNIRDIIACTALYRPGPLQGGLVDEYIECKHGRKKPTYVHPVMEEVLNETYGVMVYQEQIMRLLNRLGGIELASAYACIKAISKKKYDIIDARKVDFIRGAGERGLDAAKAEEIFELIVKFGGYGFNKSHSAAYAYMSYHTAYLKRHYTPEFMAALLSSEVDDGNKRDILVDHIHDARQHGVEVLAPSVNHGDADFTVVNGKIVFGLTALKGVGRGAAEGIVEARQEKGPFRDIFDFCERVDLKRVTNAAIEKLIKGGAFDEFARPRGHRAQVMAALPRAVQAAEQRQEDRRRGQLNFFDMLDTPEADKAGEPIAEAMPEVPHWTNTETLTYEKEVLDFYFSSHPLAEYDADLRRYATHQNKDLLKIADGAEVRLGGMLTQIRFMSTKQGKRYVRCKLEDFTGQAECMMWPDEYAVYKDYFLPDKVCLAEATVDRGDRAEPVIVMKKMLTIDEAKKELTKAMVLRLTLGQHGPDVVNYIASILRRTPGPCTVYMQIRDANSKEARFRLSNDFRIHPGEVKVEELEMLLGKGAVIFTGK